MRSRPLLSQNGAGTASLPILRPPSRRDEGSAKCGRTGLLAHIGRWRDLSQRCHRRQHTMAGESEALTIERSGERCRLGMIDAEHVYDGSGIAR